MTILPQLEHDLFDLAEQRLPAAGADTRQASRRTRLDRRGRRPGLRRRLSTTARTLPVLLGTGLTLVVAALALTLARHTGRPPAAPPARPPQTAPARQQLIEAFGVLRRRQVREDRDADLLPGFLSFASRHAHLPAGLRRRLAQLGDPELDRSLVRVVAFPAWHGKVGIDPTTWRPSASSRRRSEGINLNLWVGAKPTIPPSSDEGTGPRPTSVGTLLAHGLALATNLPGGSVLYGVVLVPDGVARVTLRPIRVGASPVRIEPGRLGTGDAPVRDNIGTFQLPIPTVIDRTAISGLFGTSAMFRATWRDSSGSVIRRTTTRIDVLIRVKGGRALPSKPRRRRTSLAGAHSGRERRPGR